MTHLKSILSRFAYVVAILSLLGGGNLSTLKATGLRRPKYQPLRFSGNDRFPSPENELIRLRDGQRVAAMRAHAWRIFAGLTHAEGPHARRPPIWDSWYTECEVQLTTCLQPSDNPSNTERLLRGFSIPAQNLQSLKLDTFHSKSALTQQELTLVQDEIKDALTKDPQLASVLYNESAKKHILDNHLNLENTLDTILRARIDSHSPEDERKIPPFPADSVVLKTGWELIYPGRQPNLRTLYIWNPEKEKNDTTLLTEGYVSSGAKQWGKTVTVDVTKQKECSDGDYSGDAVIPLGCFYFIQLSPKLSQYWRDFANSVNKDSPKTDEDPYAVLMAVHVTTKEIGDWVWATFWWYNKATYPRYGCDSDCRSILKGNKWRHFLMDTAFSGSTPLESDYGHKICFNRYLEEKMPYGIVSNCIQCHRRAVYKAGGKEECAYTLGRLPRCTDTEGGSLKKCVDVVPSECSQSDKDYYVHALQTDLLWTIADVNDPAKQKIQAAFVQLLETLPGKR
jgi:hypothetical protein